MDERRPSRQSKATSLYRLFDTDDELLYIGIAGNPGRRFEQHAKDKPWWSEVDHMTVEHFEDREAALTAERDAIVQEAPRYNVVHSTKTGLFRAVQLLVWECDECGLPIANHAGYLELDLNDLRDYEKGVREWKEAHPSCAPGAGRLLSMKEWDTYPEEVSWLAHHIACDPTPEGESYWIGVERIRTLADVLAWTSHLMEKSWLRHTDWGDLVGRIARQDGHGMEAAG